MRRRTTVSAACLCLTAALLATACSNGGTPAAAQPRPSGSTGSPTPSASATPTPPPVDPARVHANELGLVPVLMYHQLVAKPSSVYDRTPADFKAELETLARENYVPITAADFVAGKIDIPAGKHPVVLTFDDGSTSQFELGADGQPKPNTAVAIIEQVAKEHPGFTPTATFYVNHTPFGTADGTPALGWLHEHGFEIGDHTVDHLSLKTLSAAKVQQQIADNLVMIDKAVPGIAVTTMALPFGVSPVDKVLAHHGAADGTSYDFAGVMLVGSNPSHSPFHEKFDPYAIPRIRSQSEAGASAADKNFISGYYLPWLQQHPDERYTSDGNPATISFPRSFSGVLAATFRGQANPY